MKYIDLRSDTVTRPSEKMREIIASAEVGDDVFGDDPTVNELQEKVARLFGKEASLYVPSGSMGNLVAIKTHTNPGEEAIFEEDCHSLNYEAGSMGAVAGLVSHTFRGNHGVMTREQVEPYIKKKSLHTPPTTLIALENTHNHAGGTIYPLEEIKKLRDMADEHGLKMHLDGARIWNASIATGITLDEYGRYFDSIQCCFSKGLGAPIGSIVIGDGEFIEKARRFRKMFGGGMRQVGILASAAIYALDNNMSRMSEDHENASFLAENLAKIDGIDIDLESVQTNIVIMNIVSSGKAVPDVLSELKDMGMLAVQFGATKIRCVTHLDLDRADIETAIEKFKAVFSS
ncbi:MAG: low-specificity L-threonine aldolase [candidate division Zixibacteria bacterium]|nr:low-specificity L-threonine aldolase [candidate division Zixibacteria bacterium]